MEGGLNWGMISQSYYQVCLKGRKQNSVSFCESVGIAIKQKEPSKNCEHQKQISRLEFARESQAHGTMYCAAQN